MRQDLGRCSSLQASAGATFDLAAAQGTSGLRSIRTPFFYYVYTIITSLLLLNFESIFCVEFYPSDNVTSCKN